MAKGKFNLSEFTIGGVNEKELTTFTRQFATLTNAGLTTIRCLEILGNMLKPGVLKKSLREVKNDVEQGTTLSEAMGQHPKAFDMLYVNMVRAGEAGGILDVILTRLAEFREKSQRIAREIKSAMIYPIAVLTIATAIVTGIMIYIVPKFKEIFKGFGVPLPGITLFLLDVADFVQYGWWKAILAVIILVTTYNLIRRARKGRYYQDYAKLYIPVFGEILRKASLSRFCRTLGTLLESGVSLVETLDILRDATGNEALGVIIERILVAVKQGDPMTKPMHKTRIFDEMTISMIEVGDEAGEVPAMMNKIADNFDNEVDAMVAGMKSLLEPVMIVGLGVIVGGIVIALFMPMISLMEHLS